jgi:hypothetical protein
MFGVFGETLAQAQRSEFFVWFHLGETAKETSGGLTTRTFRPSAKQFYDLVAVQLSMDEHDRLQSSGLMVHRAFIDDPESSTFAADITKSFLVASLDPPDLEVMAEAAMQIRAYAAPGSRMKQMFLRGEGPAPLAPGEGEPEYLTYAGKRRQFQRALNGTNLAMLNETDNGVEQLRITITPK